MGSIGPGTVFYEEFEKKMLFCRMRYGLRDGRVLCSYLGVGADSIT